MDFGKKVHDRCARCDGNEVFGSVRKVTIGDESVDGVGNSFIRQCRHDIDTLPKFRPKRPINLTESELSALKSLRACNDIVIKPADKGGALVVWRADLYWDEAHRQLSDTAFYSRVDRDLTPTHQTTISNTIHKNIRETQVHSNLHQESSPLSGTFSCGVAQCKTCKFIDSSTVISAPKSTYNIQHNFTCTSTHLIFTLEKLEDN